MLTQAQKRFDSDYAILRRLILKGQSKKEHVRAWIKMKGEQVAEAAEQEVQVSQKIGDKLKRQSKYELELMDEIHQIENGEDDKDE